MNPGFEEIYHQLKHPIYALVLSYLQNPEDAEEVTQDVFMEIYSKADGFLGQSAFHTWAYRIAVNKSLDFIRYKNRKKRFAFFSSLYKEESTELKFEAEDVLNPELALVQKEQLSDLYKSINSLNEQQRTAILLIFVAKLPYKEAAIAMEISVKALESLVMRAKANLRKKINPNNREGFFEK